ncbi:MAG: aspartate carbamoyltransferase [Candidatus Nealsonbacteria bacterium CG02_land_8_20_14_3_00_37_10]|uniref:Aspartate carbamoyltransferase n=1 Tax=Candidatus Nealsonbacteria bacterium CG02_land_8_20_14_3_00_37_10 TaxID=1974699 RepID=A0A2M7D9H5_9BACT|nr:MAG: aspartate carbamoyltransferase [Candidatus Nealsonbacteria bacterium CG02_land_8_20_14_3_00_37_10]
MKMKHIIEARQFEKEWLEKDFFPLVKEMEAIAKRGGSDVLRAKKMISFFYEPSTRTRCSFEVAMTLLGGKVVFSTENARQFSSVSKGETLEDTIRILNGYHPDVIVLRYDKEGGTKIAAQFSSVPIINAGDGTGEHPTQALLDIYTIQKEFGKIDGISIAMVGDLTQGRTVHSLSYLLSKFSGIKIYFVSPVSLKMKDEIKNHLKKQKVSFFEETDLRKIAPLVDVIYQTRIQKERGSLIDESQGFYNVNQEILNLMKKEAIVMHPLPRNEEISPEVDSDSRAAYFRQAENGLYVRMALLKMILS